jgi:hypothetical protein
MASFKSGQAVRLSGRVSAWRDQAGKERLGLVAEELTALAKASRGIGGETGGHRPPPQQTPKGGADQ